MAAAKGGFLFAHGQCMASSNQFTIRTVMAAMVGAGLGVLIATAAFAESREPVSLASGVIAGFSGLVLMAANRSVASKTGLGLLAFGVASLVGTFAFMEVFRT